MAPTQHGNQWLRRLTVASVLLAILIAAVVWTWKDSRFGNKATEWDVVLITLDTTRADYLGCYGRSRANTPTIDRLGREGVRFERCYTPAPLTLPAHSSLLTGLLPARHGIHSNGEVLSAEVDTLAEILARQGYATAAAVGAFVLDNQFGLVQGFETYDDDMSQGHETSRFHYPERNAQQVTDAALAWWNQKRNGPRFLWVHYFDPHAPYAPPGFDSSFAVLTPYDAEIAYVDGQLERLLAAIDASGRETLVVLAADHGEGLGEHGEPTHGLFTYNSTLRVPLIVRFPDGRQAGQVGKVLVSLVDVMPSVLNWLGISTPDGMDGRAIAENQSNRTASSGGEEIIFENRHITENYGWSPLRGMIEGDWKLIQAPRPELYNLANDPREESNLADQEPERFDEMNRRLESRLSSITAVHSPVATSRELDDDALRKLESLGYVGGGVEISRDEKLADPKDMVETFERIQLAMAYVEENKFSDATEKLVAVIDDPSQPRANPKAIRLLASLVAEESAAREQGIPCLQRLASRSEFPEKQDVFQALAMGLMEERRYAEAIEPWQRLIELVPLHAAANYQLAEAYQQTGDTAHAIETYQESLRLLDQVEKKPDWFEDAKEQLKKLSSGSQ